MASNRTREPLRGAFIAILAAAIGAGGTLIGNQLASSNARAQLSAQFSHDDSIRQHDSRQNAYAEFISAASQYELDLIRLGVTHADDQKPPSKTEFKEITGDAARLQTLSSEVRVVGSAKAASLAVVVRNALDDIINSALKGEVGPEELVSRANDIEPKIGVFVIAARDELNK